MHIAYDLPVHLFELQGHSGTDPLRTQRDRPAVFTKKIPIKKEKEKKIRLLCILGQQLGILLLIPAIATINSRNYYY